MSCYTRQRFLLYQVHRKAEVHKLFYSVLFWFPLSSCCLVAAIELLKLEIFRKINLNQNIELTRIIWTEKG